MGDDRSNPGPEGDKPGQPPTQADIEMTPLTNRDIADCNNDEDCCEEESCLDDNVDKVGQQFRPQGRCDVDGAQCDTNCIAAVAAAECAKSCDDDAHPTQRDGNAACNATPPSLMCR